MRVGGGELFYRRAIGLTDAVPILHVHGFAISGAYLMPTARRLVRHGVNIVPDLPGYGRSRRRGRPLDIGELADAVLAFVDALDLDKVVLVGNSMGCPVSLEVAHAAPDRVDRIVLVSPAGGLHNQPLPRALLQLFQDGMRESPRMAGVAVPDYVRFGPLNALRLFHQLTLFPSLERLVHTPVPALAVLGSRDPLMPGPPRVVEVARMSPEHVSVVVIHGAAHAINFSHPGELANVISAWLEGREIIDDPDEPGEARVFPVPRD
ncbi:MAG: alpha/beta hydrolase [Ornithinibacter sp.]|nr:alpha/beta hydrolase [Ornithinibacter sp.]